MLAMSSEGVGGQTLARLRAPLMIREATQRDDWLPASVRGRQRALQLLVGGGLFRSLPQHLGLATGGARSGGCGDKEASGGGAGAERKQRHNC